MSVSEPYVQEDEVNHPAHYGGGNDPYEAIKVIQAWELGFELGNCVKYICRAGKKPGVAEVVDLRKARWYLTSKIDQLDPDADQSVVMTVIEAQLQRIRVLEELCRANGIDPLQPTVAHNGS